MNWQLTGLVLFSVTLLPVGMAMAAGRIPLRMRGRLAPVRPRGWCVLAIYSVAPLNAVPRLADASPGVSLTCTAAGGVLAVTSCLLLGIATHRHGRRSGAGLPERAAR
ncbi:hypothetical protein [Streptomyces sp. NPDC054797]